MMIVAWRTAPGTVTACSRRSSGAARVVKLARSVVPDQPEQVCVPAQVGDRAADVDALAADGDLDVVGARHGTWLEALDPQGAVEAEVRGDDEHG